MPAKKKSDGKNLSPGDAALWVAATDDVKRLPGREYKKPAAEKPAAKPQQKVRETALPPKPKPEKKSLPGVGLDRRTDERLRKGQMKIEGRIDLHGLNQGEAHEALQGFIQRAYRSGKRCVLVITGKGARSVEEGGVLRKRVPGWLAAAPLDALILKTYTAKPKDGGQGALYVLLRRKRQ